MPTFLCFQQVWCSGVFELRLSSFKNEHGLNMEGNCCNGVRTSSSTGAGFVCSSPCNTFFTICLTHYQNTIPDNPKCTFGSVTTEVLGGNNVDFENLDTNPLKFQFENVTWPVSIVQHIVHIYFYKLSVMSSGRCSFDKLKTHLKSMYASARLCHQ